MGFFDGLFGGDDTSAGEDAARNAPGASPFTTTSGSGQGAFTPATKGGQSTLNLNLSPELAQAQQGFFGTGQCALNEVQNMDSQAFGLERFNQLQNYRRPGEDANRSRLLDQLGMSGRTGVASGTGVVGGGGAVNPEMAAFYEAQARNRSTDALTADQESFQRFNDLIKRSGGAFGLGQGLEEPLLRQAQIGGALSNTAQGQEAERYRGIIQGIGADAQANSGDSFFDTLLNTGLSVGANYLTGGLAGAAGGAFGAGLGFGGGTSTLLGGLGTTPFSQQSQMLASQVF